MKNNSEYVNIQNNSEYVKYSSFLRLKSNKKNANGQCLLKQPRSVTYPIWNQYDEDIPKKCRAARLFVTTKNTYSAFIINSRIIIQISCKTVWRLLQERKRHLKNQTI